MRGWNGESNDRPVEPLNVVFLPDGSKAYVGS